MTDLAKNRRSHVRFPVNLEYFFFLDDQEYTGKITNISLNGAFLAKPTPEFSRTYITRTGNLKILLNNELLSLKCDIIYAVERDYEIFPAGAGVCFSETDEETQLSVSKLAAALKL
ncbi:MAG: PilZ domain-containing protein [Methylovulum sp.]|nr:PilZ domain-containing protein [Methylovulum sp.]